MAQVQRRIVHKQFNSPIALYSDTNVKETLDRELKTLNNGAVGWVCKEERIFITNIYTSSLGYLPSSWKISEFIGLECLVEVFWLKNISLYLLYHSETEKMFFCLFWEYYTVQSWRGEVEGINRLRVKANVGSNVSLGEWEGTWDRALNSRLKVHFMLFDQFSDMKKLNRIIEDSLESFCKFFIRLQPKNAVNFDVVIFEIFFNMLNLKLVLWKISHFCLQRGFFK